MPLQQPCNSCNRNCKYLCCCFYCGQQRPPECNKLCKARCSGHRQTKSCENSFIQLKAVWRLRQSFQFLPIVDKRKRNIGKFWPVHNINHRKASQLQCIQEAGQLLQSLNKNLDLHCEWISLIISCEHLIYLTKLGLKFYLLSREQPAVCFSKCLISKV